jgi:transcription antitermination protein NusB
MGNRRRARELAMQALYFFDMSQDEPHEIIDLYCQYFMPPKYAEPFFQKIVDGVTTHKVRIDTIIERFSNNWKVSRMSCVDRNIMRIAVYEMLFCSDIPLKVSINEAIDVGKKFGTDESGSFINGILDSIRVALETNVIKPGEEI